MRTVSGFSCFAIELQLKCLLCVFLGAFPARLCTLLDLDQVFLSFQRSPLSPDCSTKPVQLCLLEVPHFSVTVISFVSSLLCAFAVSLSRGAITSQLPQSVSVSARNRLASSHAVSHRFSSCISFEFSVKEQQAPPCGLS